MYSLRMEHKVFGYLLIEASGIQVHRFINICHFREIALNNLKMNGDTAEFVIAESDRQEIIDIGSKYGVSICVKKARGIPFYIRYYGKRWGFVIGAVLCYAFLLFMSGCVWEMEMEGNSYYSDDSLNHFLKEKGIFYGCRMSGIDCEKTELIIRKSLPQVAWCSLQKEGCKLILTITESTNEPNDEDAVIEEGGISLSADREATIQSIVTRAGEAQVVAGAQVMPGDVLIEGYVAYMDDFGTITGYKAVHAQGDVIATFAQPYEDSIDLRMKKGDAVLTVYHELGAINKLFPYMYYPEKVIFTQENDRVLSKEEGIVILENRFYEEMKKWEENGYEIVEKNLNIDDNNNILVHKGTLVLKGPLGVEVPCKIPIVSEETDEFNRN